MTIPDYQNIMLPLLKFAEDKKEHSIIMKLLIIKIIALNRDKKS